MKKKMRKKVSIMAACVLVLAMVSGSLLVNAEPPAAFWSFEESAGEVWQGENSGLDAFVYDETEKAAALTTYNMGWAGRFGGVAIKGNVGVKVSAEKNRYLVLSVKTDADSAKNAYDNLGVIYYKNGDAANANWASTPKDAASGIHGASSSAYTKIIIDLGWTEEFTLDTLRLDIMSASLSAASSDTDGAGCGKLYVNYIALFDTEEAAKAFVYPEPSAEENPGEQDPGTQNPTPDTPKEPETDPGYTNPTTGDDSVLLFGCAAAVLMSAMVVFSKKREQ